MLKAKNIYCLLIAMMGALSSLHAMVHDNRFIPLLQRPWLGIEGTRSTFAVDGMFATASKAVNDRERDIGLAELFGTFDQRQLSRAFVLTGKPNPLRSDWQGVEKINWKIDGKMQMQGISFAWNQLLMQYLSMGFSWLFMYVNTRHEFKLGQTNLILGPSDVLELDEIRRSMFSMLELCEGNTKQVGFGDIDAYMRVGNVWDYIYKFRRIDVGLRVGTLIPSGVRRDINRPASIPFGGNGHWGFYVQADGLFEVKEDIKIGVFGRINKRFARTSLQRMPVSGEPVIFGALVGDVRIDPGVTGIASLYLILEHLRKGLGVSVQYTATAHEEDDWHDCRTDKTIPIPLQTVERQSEWASDYFTLNVFYDFGTVKLVRNFDPIISVRWDVPALLFVTKNIYMTHKISLGIEFAY